METKSYLSPLPIILDLDTDVASPELIGFGGAAAPEQAAHAEILHRAYTIWESAGRPENRDLANWLEAEAEVSGEKQETFPNHRSA
ncbi:MAG: DUF2934 domain-containing protein [Undibacterium sp.]|nr:DUF2934 domain-containing protein [Opitutaceae bacterium]